MKLLYFIMVSFILGTAYSYGQCAIAVCAESGYYGYAYNNGTPGDNAATDDTYGALALKACRDAGGINCKLIGVYDSAGWWAIIVGRDKNGHTIVQAANGQASESDARTDALKSYRESGGVNPEKYKMAAWRVHRKE